MFSKRALKMIVLFLVALVIIVYNFPIFIVSSNSLETTLYNLGYSNINNDICILKYSYTTGTGWLVSNSGNSKLLESNIVLYNLFDPRLLKDNREFDLDYLSKFIVLIDKIEDNMINGEYVKVVYPKKIIILYDSKKNIIRLEI